MELKEFFKNSLLNGNNLFITLADSSSVVINSTKNVEDDFEKRFLVDGYFLSDGSNSQDVMLININQITKIEVSKEKFE